MHNSLMRFCSAIEVMKERLVRISSLTDFMLIHGMSNIIQAVSTLIDPTPEFPRVLRYTRGNERRRLPTWAPSKRLCFMFKYATIGSEITQPYGLEGVHIVGIEC